MYSSAVGWHYVFCPTVDCPIKFCPTDISPTIYSFPTIYERLSRSFTARGPTKGTLVQFLVLWLNSALWFRPSRQYFWPCCFYLFGHPDSARISYYHLKQSLQCFWSNQGNLTRTQWKSMDSLD